jgi:hypothetical protein
LTEKKISSKERSGLLFLAKGSEVLFIPKVTGSHSNSILQTSNSSSEEIYKSNGSFPKDEETLVSITVTNRS